MAAQHFIGWNLIRVGERDYSKCGRHNKEKNAIETVKIIASDSFSQLFDCAFFKRFSISLKKDILIDINTLDDNKLCVNSIRIEYLNCGIIWETSICDSICV